MPAPLITGSSIMSKHRETTTLMIVAMLAMAATLGTAHTAEKANYDGARDEQLWKHMQRQSCDKSFDFCRRDKECATSCKEALSTLDINLDKYTVGDLKKKYRDFVTEAHPGKMFDKNEQPKEWEEAHEDWKQKYEEYSIAKWCLESQACWNVSPWYSFAADMVNQVVKWVRIIWTDIWEIVYMDGSDDRVTGKL